MEGCQPCALPHLAAAQGEGRRASAHLYCLVTFGITGIALRSCDGLCLNLLFLPAWLVTNNS